MPDTVGATNARSGLAEDASRMVPRNTRTSRSNQSDCGTTIGSAVVTVRQFRRTTTTIKEFG